MYNNEDLKLTTLSLFIVDDKFSENRQKLTVCIMHFVAVVMCIAVVGSFRYFIGVVVMHWSSRSLTNGRAKI